jgi:hypothetical protein
MCSESGLWEQIPGRTGASGQLEMLILGIPLLVQRPAQEQYIRNGLSCQCAIRQIPPPRPRRSKPSEPLYERCARFPPPDRVTVRRETAQLRTRRDRHPAWLPADRDGAAHRRVRCGVDHRHHPVAKVGDVGELPVRRDRHPERDEADRVRRGRDRPVVQRDLPVRLGWRPRSLPREPRRDHNRCDRAGVRGNGDLTRPRLHPAVKAHSRRGRVGEA